MSELHRKAIEALQNAYSPYSQKRVGASVKTKSGKIYGGCNVENSSFGATLCAERVAIFKAISEEGFTSISEICVVSEDAWPPCGMCRQVMSEFVDPTTAIHIANLKEIKKTLTFSELLPEAFNKKVFAHSR